MLKIIEQFVGLFIMMVGVSIFERVTVDKKITISKIKFICLLVIITLIHTATYLNLEGTIKTVVMFLTNMIFGKIAFNISYKKAIFLTFLYMIFLILPDLLVLFFVTKILGLSKEYCYDVFAGSILGNLTICVLITIFTLLLKKILKKLIDTKIEDNQKILFFSLLIFICIGMFFYSIIANFKFKNDIFLYLTAMIVLILVLSSLIKQTIENNKITKDYDQLLEFMKTYELEIENQRTLRHETKNEFLAIRSKIQDKQENEEIVKYIDVILNDKIEVKQEQYAKFVYLPANGIKGLCYFKVQEAEKRGIKVSLNISKRIENSTIYDLDIKQQREFGRILGVFLDNAIEASSLSEEKQLGIETYVNKKKEFKMIISNSYSNEIDKTKIGKEIFSTKGKGRGHGLLLVKRITNNNQIFETETNIQEKIYSQTVIIRNIKNSE